MKNVSLFRQPILTELKYAMSTLCISIVMTPNDGYWMSRPNNIFTEDIFIQCICYK